jgi:hypothetical protein
MLCLDVDEKDFSIEVLIADKNCSIGKYIAVIHNQNLGWDRLNDMRGLPSRGKRQAAARPEGEIRRGLADGTNVQALFSKASEGPVLDF